MLELGAGPGVAGLVAGRVAQKCFLTDYHHEVCCLQSPLDPSREMYLVCFSGLHGAATTFRAYYTFSLKNKKLKQSLQKDVGDKQKLQLVHPG